MGHALAHVTNDAYFTMNSLALKLKPGEGGKEKNAGHEGDQFECLRHLN